MSNLKDFEKEIEIQVDKFLSKIVTEWREGFEFDKTTHKEDKPGFPIFNTADNLFYKSKFQEGYLEWLLRDLLVNELLNYLFISHGYDIRWRLNNSRMTTGGFRNKENEDKFPIEFLIVIDGQFIAFRYTPFTADYSISRNLPSDMQLMYRQTGLNKISQWVSIYWTELSRDEVIKKNNLENILKKEEPFQTIITIKGLFDEYFSVEEYDLFISKIKEAVSKANELMGFQTIPRLVSNNISAFKEDVLEELANIDFSRMEYQMINEKGEEVLSTSSKYVLQKDTEFMYKNFYEKSRYLALGGIKKFAQSFITSEYLYRIFKEGVSFDYTAVVSGYIKSVEQLSACIVYDILVEKADPNLFIKSRQLSKDEISILKSKGDLKKFGKYFYVSMKKENKNYFDYKMTMGQLFCFFDNNKKAVFSIDSTESEPQIYECMQNYYSFDRNGYFHKHNITDYNIVRRIRNNTLLILYWLLGATILTGDDEVDYNGLGIADTSFDRLFKKIVYRHNFRYILKMKDKPECKVIRLFTGKGYSFDTTGFLQGAQLQFHEVDEYPENYLAYKIYVQELSNSAPVIVIDRDHLPEAVYVVNDDDSIEQVKY